MLGSLVCEIRINKPEMVTILAWQKYLDRLSEEKKIEELKKKIYKAKYKEAINRG